MREPSERGRRRSFGASLPCFVLVLCVLFHIRPDLSRVHLTATSVTTSDRHVDVGVVPGASWHLGPDSDLIDLAVTQKGPSRYKKAGKLLCVKEEPTVHAEFEELAEAMNEMRAQVAFNAVCGLVSYPQRHLSARDALANDPHGLRTRR